MTKTNTQFVQPASVTGNFVQIQGEDFYQILNFDEMPPFLMSIVSPSDHWMYVSSTGGLTAGRVCAENCLFPYQTVDQLHDSYRNTGPLTLVRYRDEAGNLGIWHPFTNGSSGVPSGSRRLLKHVAGDQVIFEEENEVLGLVFRYCWRTSNEFGFVRTSSLENVGTELAEIEVFDGLQNICPSGVPLSTYQQASCLVDAYKHNEVDASTGLGIYSLTSLILDRAEAAESLQATTVWCLGLEDHRVALSPESLQSFTHGETVQNETEGCGRRGNYFVSSTVCLAAGQTQSWHLVADVNRSHSQLAHVRKQLLDGALTTTTLELSIETDHKDLLLNIGSADGLQATGSPIATTHHFANVLFNNMRGGVSAENYWVESRDFLQFINVRNRTIAAGEQTFLRALPERLTYTDFLKLAEKQDNADLIRLAHEYLPLTFGRRHGDPSRPWNAFEIKVRHDDASKIYNYQGNWRDIFQNWEALCMSFPVYLPSIVAKFVNASTVDGFNPYRITTAGIDWEVPEPEDPWSNIGYWGDHQIIYLTKLLEAMIDFFPGKLQTLLEQQAFCYANVPYRIKAFDEIAAHSSETIDFDQFTAKEIDRRVDDFGTDGKLVLGSHGEVYTANLIEKLLVPILAKLSNFVIDGGIWLNTQRPEWNDANNALVGSGLSMVTVCYLRRHLNTILDILKEHPDKRFAVSVEVEQWFRGVRNSLQENRSVLHQTKISDQDRGQVLGELGRAFSDYRLKVYDDGFSGKHTIASNEVVEFLRLAADFLDHSIRANRREDGLYHAYNLLEFDAADGAAKISHLYEMLEGQVAVLSSGALDVGQAAELVNAMFDSKLYRPDQRSFMLYPDRKLGGFLQRNQIAQEHLQAVELLAKLIESGDESIAVQDEFGDYHFHHTIQRQADLVDRLAVLEKDDLWNDFVVQDRERVLDLFEAVFHHKTYTGRSGTMYGYEGLGCIYWHMVSKLLLAIQENVFAAIQQQASKSMIESLANSYYLVRGGLSSDKTPSEYGAFPTDPYSHTPKHSGASQPGMTGQVKEEILTRRGELGVCVRNGCLHFQPFLLRRREFFEEGAEFDYFDLEGTEQSIPLPAGSLAFTVCQVPIVYRLADAAFSIAVSFADGRQQTLNQDSLDPDSSLQIFQRTGEITQVEVSVPDSQIQFA